MYGVWQNQIGSLSSIVGPRIMALSPRFLDDVKARIGLSDLIGRKVKLTKTGREHQGLCPFHSEKTPSFTVNDQKGFYHCFGCGAHGSAIDFVMETEGLGFREAVEQLASQAGLEMPEEDPRDIERRQAQKSLGDVMEDVTAWYEAQLKARSGAEALRYLQGRGLKPETIAHFRLGYAPQSRTALKEALIARGHTEQALIDTGMLIKPDDGGPSYDRFRNRVMFPILDRQGRLVAFGGRALDKDAKAKYLNSPETVLFHKGANLYNWPGARQAAYDGGELLVVEGYMDVIALWEAGVTAAVAPLGTALTEEQIGHLWTMAEEPILSFDGDKAGLRAARRAMERALPLLRPGKSLRFLLMDADSKDDPDTYIRREGKEAFEQLMDGATPLVDFLWKTMSAEADYSTPERRAGFEKQVFMTLAEIADDNVKKLYQSEFRSRIWEAFRASQPQRFSGGGAGTWTSSAKGYGDGKHGRPFKPPIHRSEIAQTALGRAEGETANTGSMERLLILLMINHPAILVRYEEAIATLPMHDQVADDVRGALLYAATTEIPLESEHLQDHLRESGHGRLLEALLNDSRVRLDWFVKPDAALGDALTAFEHIRARLLHLTEMKTAFDEATREFEADMNEETQARFLAAQEAYKAAEENVATIDNWGLESNRLPSG